jgi:hypothetical protein
MRDSTGQNAQALQPLSVLHLRLEVMPGCRLPLSLHHFKAQQLICRFQLCGSLFYPLFKFITRGFQNFARAELGRNVAGDRLKADDAAVLFDNLYVLTKPYLPAVLG